MKAPTQSASRLSGRVRTKENIGQNHTPPAQDGSEVSLGLAAERQAATPRQEETLTTLYRGAYRAHSRQIYLPEPDGRQRPIGIAALEDKIVQQAVVATPAALVRTRLYPPFRASGTILRARLMPQIETIRQHSVTIVKAPAGYGKTVLLRQWYKRLGAENVALGWLSLDKVADDLRSFFDYAVSAIQVSRPNFGDRLGAFFRSARRWSVAGATAAFTNALLDDEEEEVFLFIDDFHMATDNEIGEALQSISAKAPRNFHLVLATRTALPLSLGQLRCQGQLIEIEPDWLCFDKQETIEFLRAAGHESISAGDIDALVAQTEGWPAAIQLAAISLAQKKTPQSFFSFLAGRHHHLSDYFDEILKNQSTSTVDFLLKTSILSRMCPDLCNAISDNEKARAELENLERESLFLYSLDDERNWYRYHHLFAKFLRRKLAENEPSSAALLHQRASDWFAQHGLMEEAFTHAIEAGDFIRAGELLDQSCRRLLYAGELSTLLRWADKIPPSVLQYFPRARLELAFRKALRWQFDDVLKTIKDIEERSSSSPADESGTDLNRIISHRKLILYHLMDDIPNLQKTICELADSPDDDPVLRGNLESALLYAQTQSYRLQGISKLDARARAFYDHAGGGAFMLVWQELFLALPNYLRGETGLAERSLTKAMEMAESIDGQISPLVAMPALVLAEILYEKNECEKAFALINRFEGEAEKQGVVDQLVSYYVTKIRLLLSWGDDEEARNVLRTGKLSAERLGFERLHHFLVHEEVRQAIATGDLEAVKRFRTESGGPALEKALKPGGHTLIRDEAIALAWCRAGSALGFHAEAIVTLRNWVLFLQNRGALKSEIRFLIVLSIALAHHGREGEALRCLREAVKKAARPRLICSFIDEGKVIENLLVKLFEGVHEAVDETTAFGLELIGVSGHAGSHGQGEKASLEDSGQKQEALVLPEALKERESEVIKLVAVGMSNKEIGARLGLTESSVKWYLQQIFEKLNVRHRTAAVFQARKFGVI